MKMLGVTIPRTHLEKPGAIASCLATERLLDCGIDQNTDDGRILGSGSDELGMRMGPYLRIDVAQIGRDQIGGLAELALLGLHRVVGSTFLPLTR